jgi:hypothetical protein
MSDINDIKTLIYATIHRNKKPIAEIAELMGVSQPSLYRYGLENESGAEMPLSRLIPLMRATSNYSILERIAYLCGFILVKMPRFRARKMDEIDMIDGYQGTTVRALASMKKFLDTPTAKNYKEVEAILLEVMQRSSEAQKFCKKELIGQTEMEFNNEE